jgi:hypothetical protein
VVTLVPQLNHEGQRDEGIKRPITHGGGADRQVLRQVTISLSIIIRQTTNTRGLYANFYCMADEPRASHHREREGGDPVAPHGLHGAHGAHGGVFCSIKLL